MKQTEVADEIKYSIHTITLYKVRNGNMESEAITADDLFKKKDKIVFCILSTMKKTEIASNLRMPKKQIDDSELRYDRGEAVGIGRVKVPRMICFNYEIPLLSFVVTKEKGRGFISSCIHLQMDGYGETEESAIIDMVNSIVYFLYENFNNEKYKESCWLTMLDLFKSNANSDILWDKYHTVQLMLAERGVATDKYSELQDKIKELEEKVKELEEKIKASGKLSMPEFPGDKMVVKYEKAVA